MEPIVVIQLANLAYQNRAKIGGLLRWLEGDDTSALSADEKLAQLHDAIETLTQIQQSQEQMIQLVRKTLARMWVCLGVMLLLTLGAVALSVTVFLHLPLP
jgi:hypothetical protein